MAQKIIITFIAFILSFSVLHSQSYQDLDKLKSPQEKVDLLLEMAKPMRKKKSDSAIFIYNKALLIAKENKLAKSESEINKNIGFAFYYKKDFKKSKEFIKLSIDIAAELQDFKILKSSYSKLGVINYIDRNFDNAITNYRLCILNAEHINDSITIVASEFMIGVCYYQQGNYPKALESYQLALVMAEKTNQLSRQALILNNIANIQDELQNYPLALKYSEQALEIKMQLKDEKGAAETKENMATVYSKMEDYDKALGLYEDILAYKEEQKDNAGLSITYMNIGYIYEKLGKFQNALDYYSRSLHLLYQQDDSKNIAVCLNNIGDIYYALGKYKQAIDSSEKSLEIGKKLQSKTNVRSSALSLTKSFVKINQYKPAYEYHVLYSQMKDSLFNEESAKQLQEMETKYQTEKKQQEIEKQNLTIEKQHAQSRSQRIMLFAMFGGLLLVVLIAIQVFRGYKQKKKANALLESKNIEIEEKNSNLNIANIAITEQKVEIEEKNLNIMDSIRYAKRIQQTILPRDQFVEKHLPNSFILYKPKDIVSGDFYWMEKVDNTIYASAVDCTGHGVPGAFVSIVGYNSLNRTLMEFGLRQPAEILNKLNDLVVDTFVRHSDSDVKDGMDMSLVSINLDTMEVEFSGAQNPLYIVNGDGIEEIKANKQPIGSSLEPKKFDNHVVETKKGDMVYLFSDGYIDQFGGPKGKKFMRKRFKELLSSIHQMDVKTQKQHLDNTIMDWMGEEEQLDDILVMGFRV
ncbi:MULTISPECIES: tetratricopeptide repeat protein [unclassified Lentimicrobium]|uniref:tetratricopeptide repeat protein n=1 Tax=unclassified Lentimicrobium TaxID=2677434 RepID=UPI001555731D|nr:MULTISPECIES: tetratricopeptide repeat protein [unclassified Lentimicrobium]NPD45948.1 tetratricopeptide repeat protein [Lentimicrobium sp. S6]NPD84285.1 tetratricopeptide repeat protein [Lentimicrobium sp. L6]